MAQNPIIDELHRIRAAHAKRFNYDLHAIVADLQRRQAGRENLSKLPLVTPRPVREVAEAPAPYGAARRRRKTGSGR